MSNWEDIKKKRQSAMQKNMDSTNNADVSNWEKEKIKRGMVKNTEEEKQHFDSSNIPRIEFNKQKSSKKADYGRGNIDLNDRPLVYNPDGSISTIYSKTFWPGDLPGLKDYLLVPGVRKGLNRQMTDDEALEWYKKTGEYLGHFDSNEAADRYAEQIHKEGSEKQFFKDAIALYNQKMKNPNSKVTMPKNSTDLEKEEPTASFAQNNSPITVDSKIVQQAKDERYKTPDVTGRPDFAKFSKAGADKTSIKVGGLEASSGLTKYGRYSHNMTDDEKAIYNYWVGKGNNTNAKKYLNGIIPIINQRTAEKDTETIKNMTEKNHAAGVIYDLGANMISPVGYASTVKAALSGENIDTNSNAFAPTRATNTVENELFKDSSPLESFLGQTGLSMAKFATTLPFGEVGALSILSSGAAGNAAYDAEKRGASNSEALAVGTLTGITEYLTEKLPLHNLLKLSKGNVNLLTKEGVMQVLKQAGIEGTEEVVSQYANALTDIAVMGNRSQYSLYKKQLIDQGMSPDEAEQRTNTEFFITQPALAFAGGAISGGVLGTGAAGIPTYKMNQIGSTMRGMGVEQDIVDTGLESEPSTNSFKEATRVADIMKNGGKVSNADIGGLYYANVEAINAENDKAQRQGIRSMLIQNGAAVSESDKLSSLMQKAFSGDPISNTEAEAIIKNDSARNVFSSATGYDIPLGTMSEMRKSVKQFSEDVVSGNTKPIYVEPKNEPKTNEKPDTETIPQTNQNTAPVVTPVSAVPITQTQKEYSRGEIKSSVSKLGKSGQKSFGINFKDRNDLEDYSKAFSAYYIAGRTGLPSEEVDKSYGQYKDVLSSDIKFSAYSAGQNDAKTETAEKVKTAASIKSFEKKESGIKDTKEVESNVAKAIDVIGKATGTKIEIVDSIEIGGKKSAANGFYKDGIIKIAKDADNPIIVVAKHEVTHRIKDIAPIEYATYKNYVVNVMTKNGTLEKNIQRLDTLYKRNGQNLTHDEILDEIAADFTEQIMTDETAFAGIVKENRNIAQKLFDIMKDFIEKIATKFKKTDITLKNTLGFNVAELQAAEKMWMKSLQTADKTAINPYFNEEFLSDEGIKYSLREEDPPKKTMTAYKLFEMGEDGNLYTLYIDRGEPYPVGKWIDAEIGNNNKTPLGKLSFRPALHCASIPFVNHIGNRDENGNIAYTKQNHVWAEVEIAADVNYQVEADKLGRKNQPNLGRVPENGYYRFPNATKYPDGSSVPADKSRWFLTGSMKITRILSDSEVNQILKPYNLTMLPRKEVDNLHPTNDADIRYSIKDSMRNIVSRIEEGTIDFNKPQGLYTTPAEFKNPHTEIEGETHYFKISSDANFYDVKFAGKLKSNRMKFPIESGATLNYLVDVFGKNEVERLFGLPKVELISILSEKYPDIEWNRFYDKHEMLEGYGGLLARQNGIDVIRQYDPEDDFSETVILNGDVANEIENIENVRFSLKGESKILKENATLKEMNEQLKSQFKKTTKITINRKKTEGYGKSILKEYSSGYDKNKLTTDLLSIFNDMSGENVDYESVKRIAKDVAFNVLDASSIINNELYQDYKDLIKRTREIPLRVNDLDKKEITYIVGDYNEFRKRNFGTLKLVNEDYGSGQTVDQYYQSLVEEHPELFDEEIVNQGDQLIAIKDVINSLKPFEENPYSDYMDEAVEYLAYDIMDQFFDIPQNRPTFADRQERKLTQAKIKAGEALRTERARRIEQIEKLKGKFKNKEQKKAKSIADRNMRIRIERIINDLSQRLLNPNDKQHVPDALKRPVAEFLKSIDFSSSRQMSGTRNKLAGLQNAYMRIAAGLDQGDSDFYLDIDPDFINVISELSDTIGDKRVIDMSSEELRRLYQIARMVKATIYNYNKLLSDDLRQDVFFKGESVIDEMRTDHPKNESGYVLINEIDKLVNFDMLAPTDFFEELGTNMTDLYNNVRRGLDKKIKNTKIITDYMANLLDGMDISEWTGNKAKSRSYELLNKRSIELTPAQVMSLYLLSKREQAQDHIYIGGIKHAPVVRKVKGRITIIKAFEPAHVKEIDVANIISTLTPEQRRIADGISEFLNTYTSDWGNEISMKLYGYRKFTEKNYFPIKSDDNYLVSEFGIYSDPSLKGKGWTKATMRKANNPIIIDDIFDVFTKMADESSSYNAFVIPLSDIQKVVNYRGAVGSVKQSIEKKFGKDAIKYLSKLIIDINGGIRTEVGNQFLNQLLTRYKAAAMGFNPRVVVQQPTAIVRAMSMIDPKYIALGIAKKGDWNTVVQYSPIAQWKSWGYFSMDIGRQIKDIFIGEKNWKDSFFFFGAIQKADNLAWSKLWNAVEYEINDTRNDLTEGTPLFYDAVGRRFSEIVDRTQVVDTVLHRTQIMRSNDTLMKVYTSFMSEPMKSYNLLRSTIRKAVETKDPEDKKKAIRTILAWAAAVAVNSLIVSLIDFYRNSEDDDKFIEFYIKSFLGNSLNDVTGMFPYVKDIASLANGFTPKRMELDGINDAVKAIKKFGNYATDIAKGEPPKYTGVFVMKDILTSASKLLGIPIYNVKREIGTFLKNYIRWTNSNELNYSIEKVFNNINNSENRSMFVTILYKAVQNGDKDAAKRIYNDMLINGIPKAYIEQGLRSRMRKTLNGTNEIVAMSESVQKWKSTPKDQRTDEMKDSIKKEFDENYKALLKMGYSEKDIQKAIEKNRTSGTAPTMKDLMRAYVAGKKDKSKQGEFYEICNRMIDAGYEKEDIEAAIEAYENKK